MLCCSITCKIWGLFFLSFVIESILVGRGEGVSFDVVSLDREVEAVLVLGVGGVQVAIGCHKAAVAD